MYSTRNKFLPICDRHVNGTNIKTPNKHSDVTLNDFFKFKQHKMKKYNYLAGIVMTAVILPASLITVFAQGKSAALPYQAAIDKAYAKYKDLKEGKNADYIKELANVD